MFSARVEIPYFFTLYLKLAELIKNRNKRDNITANGLNYHTTRLNKIIPYCGLKNLKYLKKEQS